MEKRTKEGERKEGGREDDLFVHSCFL